MWKGTVGVGMSDVYVARQPIFGRNMRVSGYELLFRDAGGDRAAADDSQAAKAVIATAMTDIGLKQIVGTRGAWIRVTPALVSAGVVDLLPAEAILEISATHGVDGELVNTIDDLKRDGRVVAVDDFRYAPETEPLLRLVDFVKLDLVALGLGQVRRQVARMRRLGLRLVANRVENARDRAVCLEAGCDLFQGYFFCRPEVMASRQIDANRLAVLDLLAVLQDPRIQLEDLQSRIALDVGLSVRLLRYINSAYFGLRQPVRSIAQALALLGLERIRPWVAMALLASIDDKPNELTITALARARFCELAARERGNGSANEMFTVGLLSVLDALMDVPIEEAVASLPFDQRTRDAIVLHAGPAGELLECVVALETADFDRAEEILPTAGTLHMSALAWAQETAEPLFAS
jgi:EAL and modified HD-GYP domain-containing signal transduction protein